MQIPFSRISPGRAAGLAGLTLAALVGTAYLAMGEMQPAEELSVSTSAEPLRPSYLVAVREPTPEELAQRRALAEATPAPRTISLTPRSAPAETPTLTASVVTDVNVRSGPGMQAEAVAVAAAGTTVTVLGEQNGWTNVALEEVGDGWISSRYLSQ